MAQGHLSIISPVTEIKAQKEIANKCITQKWQKEQDDRQTFWWHVADIV